MKWKQQQIPGTIKYTIGGSTCFQNCLFSIVCMPIKLFLILTTFCIWYLFLYLFSGSSPHSHPKQKIICSIDIIDCFLAGLCCWWGTEQRVKRAQNRERGPPSAWAIFLRVALYHLEAYIYSKYIITNKEYNVMILWASMHN